MRWRKRAGLALGIASAGLGLGCSAAFGSSNSVSGSLGSVSKLSESVADSGSSISSSSSDESYGEALEQDVSTYTSLFTESGADVTAYLRGVGALCETYAIVDWEREPAVRRGIALGLARSRLSPDEIDVFTGRVAGDDSGLRELLRTAALALR